MLEPSPELARRLEGTEVELGRALVRSYDALFPRQCSVFVELGGGALYATGRASRVARVVGLGLRGPVDGKDLDRMEQLLEERGLEAEIALCDQLEPSLRERLVSREFQEIGVELAFVRELRPADRSWGAPPGFAIHGMHPREAALWAGHVARCFGDERESRDLDLDTWIAHAGADGFLGFLARADGEVVGVAAMQTVGDVACFFGQVTDPRHRGRGVQAAMIAHGLAMAAERGLELAQLHARPDTASARNARRAGFTESHARRLLARTR